MTEITVLTANGTQCGRSGHELMNLVDESVAARYTIINHDSRDQDRCQRIGERMGLRWNQ